MRGRERRGQLPARDELSVRSGGVDGAADGTGATKKCSAFKKTRTTYEYVVDLRKRLEDTCKTAQEELKQAKNSQKARYDAKSRPRELKPGDKVLILLPTEKTKLIL